MWIFYRQSLLLDTESDILLLLEICRPTDLQVGPVGPTLSLLDSILRVVDLFDGPKAQ